MLLKSASSFAPFALSDVARACVVAVSVCASVTAHAQPTPSQAPVAGSLSEVTVTDAAQSRFGSSSVQVGTFRDQSPLDVPLTTNVISRDVLDAQGQRTLYGALRNTAGVTRAQLGGALYDNIAIRGILVENRGNYRLNGALPIVNQMDIPLENKERVEVLKGISSLYYGLVPPSGMVNFVTKRAGKEDITRLHTSVNSHGAVDAHLDLGRRFGEQAEWGVRINAVAGKEELGIDAFSGDRQLLSAAVDYKVNRSLALKFDVEHYRKNVTEQAAIQLPANATSLPPVPANTTNAGGEWAKTKGESTNWLARADLALSDNWTALVEVGRASTERDRRYSQFELANVAAYTTGAGVLRTSYNMGQSYVNTNYRAEATGQLQTGSLLHDLTVGYGYNLREQDTRTSPAVSTTYSGQNLYQPIAVPVQAQPTANGPSTSEVSDKGLYAFDRITLNDQWQAMAGVRASRYSSRNVNPAGTPYRANDSSPSVSVLYKPLQHVSLYASHVRGLEAGRLVPVGGTTNYKNGGQLLPAAVNRQNEVGVKAMLGQSMLLQAAYFDISRAIETVGANNTLTVDGRARYKGVEVALSGELSRQFAVVASAMVLDPKIVSSTTAAQNGNIPGNTAKQTFSLFGEYRLPSVAGLGLNAGWYYTGKRPLNNANKVFLPGVGTLSVGARYATKWQGKPVTLQANIDNATNKRYYSAADVSGNLVSTGMPRTVRVAATFGF